MSGRKNTEKTKKKKKKRSSVLVVGCANAGKSLLVKQMCARSKAGAVPGFGKYNRKKRSVDDNRKNKNGKNVDGAVRLETQPTVGVEIDSLDAGKKGVVLLREVGSPMMAMWSSYFEDCDAVIFIVSRGDRLRLAESAVEFWQLLQHEHIVWLNLKNPEILLNCSIDQSLIKQLLRLLEYLSFIDTQLGTPVSCTILARI